MFNLVGKRYLFLIISLIVIVPGTISLIFRGLNLGIDFAGGTNIELRPQTSLTSIQIQNLVKPLNLASLQIVPGDNSQLPGNQNVWVRLNTRIDTVVQKAIQNALQAKYGTQLSVTFDDLVLNPLSGTGKATTVTVVTITKFQSGVTPKISDVLPELQPGKDLPKGRVCQLLPVRQLPAPSAARSAGRAEAPVPHTPSWAGSGGCRRAARSRVRPSPPPGSSRRWA